MAGRGNRRGSIGSDAGEQASERRTPSIAEQARFDRLTERLTKAEHRLDHLHDTLDAGSMTTQREVAGQRAKVLGLRAELTEIEMCRLRSGSDRWRELRESRDAILRAVKEAEHAARNASKQETDDLLRQLMQERERRSDARKKFEAL